MYGDHEAITVGPVVADVDAAPALVFQMLAAIGQGTQASGEHADVLERHGDEIVADFWTSLRLPVGRPRLLRTRERVRIVPPDRVEYEHLDGPARGLRESIVAGDRPGGSTRLIYTGTYTPSGVGRSILFRLVTRGMVERVMRDHFADLAARAEARQARSRAFRRSDAGGPG